MEARIMSKVIAMIGILAASLVIVALPARAAQDVDPPALLAGIRSLTCSFPVAAFVEWKDGVPVAQSREQQLNFEIRAIELQEGTAEHVGTTGRIFVSAVLSGWSLYFVENAVGRLNVTTVFAQEAAPGRLKAVHSRHGYVEIAVGRYVSEPFVSQNYGECQTGSAVQP
jgi:hypothetical protein